MKHHGRLTRLPTNLPTSRWRASRLTEKPFSIKKTNFAAAEARVDALKIERDGMNVKLMKNLDYVARAVEGSREYGPDSALYGGFGYVRDSEKKRGGGRKKTT